MFLNGLEFTESNMMFDSVEVQSKTHKNKRINKKWLKRYGTKIIHVPKKELFIFNGKAIGHPKTIKRVIRKMKDVNKD